MQPKKHKTNSLKTIFILKSQFTLAAIIINHFLLRSSMLMSKLNNGLPDNVSSKMRTARQQIWNNIFLIFCFAATDLLLHFTHFISLSLWRFSSTFWTDELNKKTLKHTRREICVNCGWLWCWLYWPRRFPWMCSCAALYWQWIPATVIIDVNCRTNALI